MFANKSDNVNLDSEILAFHKKIESSYKDLLDHKQKLGSMWNKIPEIDKRNFETIERIWQSLHPESINYIPNKP